MIVEQSNFEQLTPTLEFYWGQTSVFTFSPNKYRKWEQKTQNVKLIGTDKFTIRILKIILFHFYYRLNRRKIYNVATPTLKGKLHGNFKNFKSIDIDSNKNINWTTFSSQELVCYKQSISNFEKYSLTKPILI